MSSWSLSEGMKPALFVSRAVNASLAWSRGEGGLTSAWHRDHNTVRCVSDPSSHTGQTGLFRFPPTSRYLVSGHSQVRSSQGALLCIISSPQTLEIGQEADLRLGGYSPQLEAAQVLVTIEHILSGHSSQHQVNQTLAPVTMNGV